MPTAQVTPVNSVARDDNWIMVVADSVTIASPGALVLAGEGIIGLASTAHCDERAIAVSYSTEPTGNASIVQAEPPLYAISGSEKGAMVSDGHVHSAPVGYAV